MWAALFKSRSCASPLKWAPHRGCGNPCPWIHSDNPSTDCIPIVFTAKCNASHPAMTASCPGISTPHTGMDTLRTDWANHSNTAHDRSPAAAAHMSGTLKTDHCWRRITLGTPPSGSTCPMRAAKDLTTSTARLTSGG